jgi:hypothetical protein
MGVSAGVSVSTITSVGSTVTVNTGAAHGLAVNQGFSLTGINPSTLNVNSTVATVSNSTSFTFTMSSPPAYVSGGNAKPAKEAVVLTINTTQPGAILVQYVLWLTTLSPVAKTNATSSWTGASTQENAALAAGTTIEFLRSDSFPSTFSEASIEAFMAADFAATQSALAASTQPGQFYGIYYDGTGWSG